MLLAPLLATAQIDNPYDHTGVQYATQGTDFWVAFPRTNNGLSANHSRLYIVSERDCDVTVSAPWLDWEHTAHIMHRQMCGPDTNYIEVPQAYSRYSDTADIFWPLDHYRDRSNFLINRPQPRAFHVTSTDTISLFIWIYSAGVTAATNVLPTELLRDEYVVQVYPKVYAFDDAVVELRVDTTNYRMPPLVNAFDHHFGINQQAQTVVIVGVEDSTVVDIVLNDWDILNRKKGDTITVTLNAGQLYHINGGEVREKYYPLFAPYFRYYDLGFSTHLASPDFYPQVTNYNFAGDTMRLDTFVVDLSGTHIKTRDCKRIAVFEGGSFLYIPNDQPEHDSTMYSDMILEQAVPTRYAGTKFLIPTIYIAKEEYIRITGLHDNTDITIIDANRGAADSRHLTVDKAQTVWFAMSSVEGPFYVETSQPVVVMVYTREGRNGPDLGDESGYAVTPEEWWHHGQINYGTITEKDEYNNRQHRYHSLYVFTRTEDVGSLRIDDYPVSSYFHPISGTSFSYARFPHTHSVNSEGTHHIESLNNRRFMAVQSSVAVAEAVVFNLPHVQPSGVTLYVNDRPADSLPTDSIWCHFEHITFRAVNNRPADSLYWDFGDGTRLAYSHHDDAYSQPVPHTFPALGRYTVLAVFTYEKEGCFTIPNDTVSVTLLFTGHVDSTISATVCEGSFRFRGEEFDSTGVYQLTTYRTLTGCDTLWTLNLSVCPHCYWTSDTVAPEELPHAFNGISFNTETSNYPIYIPVGDTCDSIIYYTLVVIPHWGEPPLDSTWVLVPNVFTPDLSSNNLFAVTCSHHIRQIEVMLFDRRGDFVYRFDGLTGHWDGTHDGRPCPQATYVYYIRYIDSKDSAWKTLTGTVSLIR